MRKKVLHILMLEDNELDAELNQEQLNLLEEYDCRTILIQEKESFIKEITSGSPPELILCDYNLPRYDGMKALKDLNALQLNIPFIFVTGTMQEEVAAEAIKAGAWDYVVKDRLFRLPLAVKSVLKLKKEKDVAIEADKKTQRLLKGIDATSMQVVVLDEEYNIDYLNHNYSEAGSFHRIDVLGKPFLKTFSSDNQKLRDAIYDILEKKESYQGEVKMNRKDGSHTWEHISITPVFSEDNEIRSYTLIANDITRQKRLEEDLKTSLEEYQILNKELEESKKKAEESDSLKTAFLANLSHEIRTPMNGILGFAGLLKSEYLSPDVISNYVNIIEQSGQRMLRLINDLVDISKIEAQQVEIILEETNLNQLMDRTFSFFKPVADKKELVFSYNKPLTDQESNIVTDKIKLEQVLYNLIDNSLKFTKKGRIDFSYKLSDNTFIFSVKDTGKGIPEEKKECIFERFRQVENDYLKETEGSGLGLSISKAFIELMGGSIRVESELGEGTEFIFSIPNKKVERIITEENTKTDLLFDEEICVLVAEDDEVSCTYLETILSDSNIRMLFAYNGRQVIQLLDEHPEAKAILMDLKMPVMDGINATIEIRKKNPAIPIIAQTAYASASDRQKAMEAGCTDFITKPISKDLLFEKLELYIKN